MIFIICDMDKVEIWWKTIYIVDDDDDSNKHYCPITVPKFQLAQVSVLQQATTKVPYLMIYTVPSKLEAQYTGLGIYN